MAEFLARLAGHWRQTFTEDLIASAGKSGPPSARLDHLNRLAVRLDGRIEQGIRRLAASEPAVALVLAETDERRVAWLAQMYEASGRYDAKDALALARIEYAAFTGLQQIMPNASPQDLRALYQDFMRLTGRA